MLLIVDANVLIDYLRVDEQVLILAGRHLGTVHVVRDVVDEVAGLDDDRCARLGLKVVEPTTEQLIEAASGSRPALSFEDTLCLLVAQENGWTCVTNDKALRRECGAASVHVLWGLQLMLHLVDKGALAADLAISIAEEVQRQNPGHITENVLTAFKDKVRGSTGKKRPPL